MPPSVITARRATAEDASQLIDPIAQLLFDYKSHVQSLWAEKEANSVAGNAPSSSSSSSASSVASVLSAPPNIEKIRRGVGKMLQNEDLGLIFVAFSDDSNVTSSSAGLVIGVAVLHREVSDWRAGFVWYINAIAVDPSPTATTGITLEGCESAAETPSVAASPSPSSLSSSHPSDVTKALATAIRAAVAADETCNGLRVMIEDPLDNMLRPFFLERGQYVYRKKSEGAAAAGEEEKEEKEEGFKYRSDSNAANARLLCEPVEAVEAEKNKGPPALHHNGEKDTAIKWCANLHNGEKDTRSQWCANLHREHYFMMTWYNEWR